MYDAWADELRPQRPEVSEDDWARFRSNMYESDKFLFNVDKDFVQTVTTPLLVLEGNDLYHPSESSLTVNELAQNATLIREWKSGAAMELAAQQFLDFLELHQD